MVSINTRFLVKIFAVILVAVGVVFGVHFVQQKRIPGALRQQIDRATEEGNADLAIRHLRQYLEFRPNDLEARSDLASRLKARGSQSELAFLYDQILRGNPNQPDVRRDAIALALQQHRYTDSAEHATKLLELEPTNGTAWRQLADAYAALHRNEDAVKAYEKAVQFTPDDPGAYQDYVTWLWTEANRTNEANEVVNRFVAAFPKRSEPLVLRSRMRMSESEVARPDIKADLDNALSCAPDDADALTLLADWLQRAGETSAARERLVQGVAQHPTDVRFPRRLAWLDLHRGNPIAAISTLETSLATVQKGYDELLVPLGDLLIQVGEMKRAEAIAKQLEAKKGTAAAVQARYLRARLAMKTGDWLTAITILSDLRTDTVSMPGLTQQANLLLGIAYRQTANVPAERECLMLVLNRDPKHVAARVALAQSFLTEGDLNAAVREYDEASRSPYVSGATAAMSVRLRTIRLQMQSNARAQDWAELERAIAALTQRFPKESSESASLLAELYFRKGESSRAVALLRQEVGRRSNDQRLWANLAERTGHAFGIAAALTVCEEGITVAGDGPDLRIAKANLYACDPLKSYPFDALDRQIDAWTDSDQSRLLAGLVDAADRLDDRAAVVRLTHRLAARRAGDPLGWVSLYEQARSMNDTKSMAFARAQLLRIEGETGRNIVYLNSLESPDRAQLEAAFGALPNRADVCLLLARCEKDFDGKRKWLDRALTIEPTNFEVVKQYLTTMSSENQSQAIRSLVTRLSIDPRWNGESLRRVVSQAMTASKSTAMLTTLENLIPPDATGLAWRGECERKLNHTAEAAAYFQKACELASATPDDYVRWMMTQPDRATAILELAKKKLPNRAYLSTAVAWSAQGHPVPSDEPFTMLQGMVQYQIARGQPLEAIRELTTAMSKPFKPAETAWIQRTHAILNSAHGNATERQQAAASLVALPIDSMTADERRSLAAAMVGLHRHIDGDLRNQLLSRASTLLQSSTSPRDRFLVFQIERAKGDVKSRQTARTILNELLKTDAQNVELLVAGLDELVEADALPQAESFAEALRKQFPDDFKAIASLTRYECAAGRADRVLPLVERWTRTGEQNLQRLANRLMKASDLLDEVARRPDVRSTPHAKAIVDAAVAKYAAMLPARMEAVSAGASLLAASGRGDEAIAFVNRFAAVVPNRALAAAGVAMLRSGTITEPMKTAARQWLDTALADDPWTNGVQLNEGEFFALTGQRDQAEKSFRAVLDRDPQNVIALNNLAWVLAPQSNQTQQALALIDRASHEMGLTPELLDTRARIHIAAKKTELAEQDLLTALTQQKTPLRYFHMALAKRNANRTDEAKALFQQAIQKGLEPGMIHPDDMTTYRSWLANGVN